MTYFHPSIRRQDAGAPSVQSRRRFLVTAGLAAVAWPAWAKNKIAETAPTKFGPPKMLLENSKSFIDKLIQAPPTGRQAYPQIFVSSNLENVFYLDLGKKALLLDTGFDHQLDHHLDNFAQLGLDLKKVVGILASHSHVDHTAGLHRARQRLSAPVLMHRHAIKPVTHGDLSRTAAVIPEVEGWKFDYPACRIDRTLDHGDLIRVGDERLEVHHIPGHTPDSVGYLWRGNFFTGDALFFAGNIGWSSPRWFSNYSDIADTMRRLMNKPVEATRFFCTHGPDLPYSTEIPRLTLEKVTPVLADENDPCNRTPRTVRRRDGAKTETIVL